MYYFALLFLVSTLCSKEVISLRHPASHKSRRFIKSTSFVTSSFQNEGQHYMSSSGATINKVAGAGTSSRVQRIKDVSLQKDILRDITACELALRIEVVKKDDSTPTIDYATLIAKLDSNIKILTDRNLEDMIPRIINVKEQLRQAFTQQNVSKLIENSTTPIKVNDNTATSEEPLESTTKEIVAVEIMDEATDKVNKEIVEELKAKVDERIRILVREDGSVDWEGAKASGKEVAKFGTELWERLNGKEEAGELPSLSEIFIQVQAEEPKTKEIERLATIVEQTKNDVKQAVDSFNALQFSLRQRRNGGAAIDEAELLTLRQYDNRVKELEKRLTIFTMNLDMEKICVYIQLEVEAAIEPTQDQKMFIAQIALIDKQITSLISGLASVDLSLDETEIAKLVSLVDDDELSLICKELSDVKSRLGLDTRRVPDMDWGSIGVYTKETISKIKLGLSFFGEGTKLLVADIQYAWLLTLKAAQGYTLKPREVNSIRRTGKDLLTLIPFTIILIIPLSPVGHVLVFGFIQRFFPEFYPSCYTEQRLNLKRMFSDIQTKNLEEDIIGVADNKNLLSIDWMPKSNSFRFDINSLSNRLPDWLNRTLLISPSK